MKQVCCIPSLKPFFRILHPTGTQNFAYFGSFFLFVMRVLEADVRHFLEPMISMESDPSQEVAGCMVFVS